MIAAVDVKPLQEGCKRALASYVSRATRALYARAAFGEAGFSVS